MRKTDTYNNNSNKIGFRVRRKYQQQIPTKRLNPNYKLKKKYPPFALVDN